MPVWHLRHWSAYCVKLLQTQEDFCDPGPLATPVWKFPRLCSVGLFPSRDALVRGEELTGLAHCIPVASWENRLSKWSSLCHTLPHVWPKAMTSEYQKTFTTWGQNKQFLPGASLCQIFVAVTSGWLRHYKRIACITSRWTMFHERVQPNCSFSFMEWWISVYFLHGGYSENVAIPVSHTSLYGDTYFLFRKHWVTLGLQCNFLKHCVCLLTVLYLDTPSNGWDSSFLPNICGADLNSYCKTCKKSSYWVLQTPHMESVLTIVSLRVVHWDSPILNHSMTMGHLLDWDAHGSTLIVTISQGIKTRPSSKARFY